MYIRSRLKKLNFVIGALAISLLPGIALADSGLSGLISFPDNFAPLFSCYVTGTNKRINNVTNQVTYKVHFSSLLDQANVNFSVLGTVQRPAANLTLYQLSGKTTFSHGEGFLNFNGKSENTFTFAIKENPGVTLGATVNGVKCTSYYLRTIQPFAITVPVIQPNVNLNPSANATSSANASAGQSQPAAQSGRAVVAPPKPGVNSGLVQPVNPVPSLNQPGQASVGGSAGSQGNSASGPVVAPSGATTSSGSGDGTLAGDQVASDESEAQGGVFVADDGVTPIALPVQATAVTASTNEWGTKDFVVVGLLGSLLVAFVTYIVMKYKGML